MQTIQAPSQKPVSGRWGRLRLRLAADTWLRVGVIAILVLGFVRLWLALRGSYVSDDYGIKYAAATQDFGWEYLSWDYFGNFMPAAFAVEWVRVRYISPEYWSGAVIGALALISTAAGLLYLMRQLVVSRVWPTVMVIWFMLITLTWETQFWWTPTMTFGLALAFQTAALVAGYEFLRRRSYIWLGVVGIVYGIALLFSAKASLTLVWAAIGIFLWSRYRPGLLRAYRAPLLLLGAVALVVTLAYAYVYASVVVGEQRASFDIGIGAGLLSTSARVLTPVLFGGPWNWSRNLDGLSNSDPTVLGVALAAELLLVLVVVAWLLRARVGWLLLCAVAILIANNVLIVVGRAVFMGSIGNQLTIWSRYLSDLAVPLSILALLAATAAVGEPRAWSKYGHRFRAWLAGRRTTGLVVGLVLANIFVISAAISWTPLADNWAKNPGREWNRVAAQSMNNLPIGQTVVNQGAPVEVVSPDWQFAATAQAVLTPQVPDYRWVEQSDNSLIVVDSLGIVKPGYIEGQKVTPKSAPCGLPVAPGATVDVELEYPMTRRNWLVEVSYLAGETSQAQFQLGWIFTPQTVTWRKGLNKTYFNLDGEGSVLKITNPGIAGVCIDSILLGTGKTY